MHRLIDASLYDGRQNRLSHGIEGGTADVRHVVAIGMPILGESGACLGIVMDDIDAWNIKAWNIKANNIDAENIEADSINANDISYLAVCFAYNDIECKTIKGRMKGAKHFVLWERLKAEENE